MKHWFALLTVATVAFLPNSGHSGNAGLSLVSSYKKELSMVNSYLEGSLSRQALEKAVDEKAKTMSLVDAVKGLRGKIPEDIVSLLRTDVAQRQSGSKQPFDQAALDRAREVLNGMIETAQEQYDLKDMECTAFDERNRGEMGQTTADLSRLGSAVAGDNAKILGSKKDIGEAYLVIEQQIKSMKGATGGCAEVRMMNEVQLETLKSDAAIAEYIVTMTECKDGAFLQVPGGVQVEECPLHGGGVSLSFKDGLLAEKARKIMSSEGQSALRKYLAMSHPSLTKKQVALILQDPAQDPQPVVLKEPSETNGTLADHKVEQELEQAIGGDRSLAAQKPEVPPEKAEEELEAELAKVAAPPSEAELAKVPPAKGPDKDKARDKCTLGKPDCGLLNDNMALMWGEVKDQVDHLTSVMAANEAQCKATEAMHNQEIATWEAVLSQKNVELTEGTGNLNANTEEQKERIGEKDMLQKEYDDVHGECEAVLHEIMFTNICGAKTVRGEISKFSEVYGPTDILDCEVTEWIPEECSIQCIPQALCDGLPTDGSVPLPPACAGGVQNMTRNIVQNKTLGADCPALVLEKPCNNVPCAIDCQMTEWSLFGKCSKECGGGIQQKSRNVAVRADNGGESCGPGSETQQCNTQSCDIDCTLHEWTPWGPCSRACNTGMQERVREVNWPKEGFGKCFGADSVERYEKQECNMFECPPNPTCEAQQDVVLVVDVSGSLKETGYETMRNFVDTFVSLYKFGDNFTSMGVVEYSKEGRIVSPLERDPAKLSSNIAKMMTWQRGITDMAQGITLAKTVLMEGRKEASSVVIVLTDAKPSFKFATEIAANNVRKAGSRLVMVPIFTYGDSSFMKELASDPVEDNVLTIGGLEHLAANLVPEAVNLMTSTCAMLAADPGDEMMEKPPANVLSDVFLPKRQQPVAHRQASYHRPGH